MTFLKLRECLGLYKVDRLYYVNKQDINPATGKAYAINPSSGVWDDNYWALQVDPVVNAAQKAQQKIDDANTANTNRFNSLVDTGRNDVTSFLTKYQSAVPDIVKSTQDKYHIPEQLDIVNALNTRIQTLKGNTDNSGGGGFSSGSQVDAAINSRYLPQYTTGMTNLANSASVAAGEENQLTKPYETEGQILSDRLAREMTGFGVNEQTTLQGIIASINAGMTLTKTQMDNANSLAVAQKNYQAAIDSQKLQNQNVTLGPGQTYYNPATGTAYNPFVKF